MSYDFKNVVRERWLEALSVALLVLLVFQLVTLATRDSDIGVDVERLYDEVAQFEGVKETVYRDVNGIPHIGVGFNLTRDDARRRLKSLGLSYDDVLSGKQSMSQSAIRRLLQCTLEDASRDCHDIFSSFDELDDVRKRALINMAFNLGRPRLRKFVKMIEAVEARDFQRAADEMINSKWYGQVGARAQMLVRMMRTGESPELNQ